MTESTTWWVIAGVLMGTELLTGTFYLLMLAFGAVAAALAATVPWALTVQMTLAALIGGGSALAWYLKLRSRHHTGRSPLGAQPDPDLALDLGQPVTVERWSPDGSAQVQYRGSLWTARLASATPATDSPAPGQYRIAAMQGSVLLLDKV